MQVISYSSIKKGQLIRENIIQRANRWMKYVSDKIEKQQKKNETSKRIGIPHQQQFNFSQFYTHIYVNCQLFWRLQTAFSLIN